MQEVNFHFQICSWTRHNTDSQICGRHTGNQTLQEYTDPALRGNVSEQHYENLSMQYGDFFSCKN